MAEAKIRISAEDRTPEGFKSVERRLREFSANAASFQNRLRNVFGGIGAAIGANAIANFAQAAIQAGIESEQAGARLDIVLRNLGDSSAVTKERVEQLAEELSRVGRFDDDDIKSAAAELLKFGNISTVVFEDALRSAKGVAAFFNEDLRSAAQKVGKALADPEAAFKLLKEVGVAFTDSQKEAIKVLGETQGIAAQQQTIVRELAKRYGDLDKELSGGLTGTVEELNKAWGNLLESFGLTVGKLTPVKIALNGLSEAINSVRSRIESASKLPGGQQPLRGSPIEDVVPGINKKRAPNAPFLPGSRTPISEIIPGSSASPISAPAFRPAPILTEDDRKRLRATLGESSATLIEPSAKTGNGKPKKDGGSTGASDFDTLRRSLESQLTRERDLTVELTLVEDERFKKLKSGQQNELTTIARRVDTLKLEKVQNETVAQSIDFEKNLREVSTREELAQIEERKTALLRDYEDRKISAQEYYSFIAAEETRSTVIQQRELELDAQIERAKSADTSAPINDRFNAYVKEAEIRQRIADIARQQTDIEQRNARAAAQADEAMLDRKVEIARKLNEIRGIQNPELDRLAIEREFRDLPEDFKKSLTFQVFLDTRIAEQQLSAFERNGGVIEQTLRLKEERISIDRDAGISTESQAREKIIAARREAVVQLEQEITKFEELRVTQGGVFGPEQEARIEAQKNKLAELKATTEDYLRDVREIGQDATADFFASFLKGGQEAIDAIDKLGEAIERNLLNKVGDELADQLFTGFGNLTKPGQAGQAGAQGGLTGLLQSGANAFGGFLGGLGGKPQGLSDSQTTEAITQAADAGAAELSDLSTSLIDSQAAADALTNTFLEAAPEVGGSLLDLSSSALEGQIATQAFSAILPTASAAVPQLVASQSVAGAAATEFALQVTLAAAAAQEAATQFAIAGATATAASAGGGFGFAKGGVFSGGAVQAFATGGIVGSPTTFPMTGGKVGLMGEAGPEAIMPLSRKGGAFSAHAVAEDGSETVLRLTRNSAGKLAVRLPTSSPSKAFALGGVFESGAESLSMKFADGAVLTAAAQRFASLPFHAYANGGVAKKPQLAIFGEGSRPEAFVPLPDGKTIPVTMDAPVSGGVTLIQNISTPDANSFRRSRASIFNDANAGLAAASSRA